MQLKIDSELYGEKIVSDDSDILLKECDAEISITREILRKTDQIMKFEPFETEQNTNVSSNNIAWRITRQ